MNDATHRCPLSSDDSVPSTPSESCESAAYTSAKCGSTTSMMGRSPTKRAARTSPVARSVKTVGGMPGAAVPMMSRLCPSTAATTVSSPVSRSIRTSRRSSESW